MMKASEIKKKIDAATKEIERISGDLAGLTFATKKEWRPLPVSNLSDLH